MSAAVNSVPVLEGDPVTNHVTVEFVSPDILCEFLETLNRANITKDGYRMEFTATPLDPGQAMIMVSLHSTGSSG